MMDRKDLTEVLKVWLEEVVGDEGGVWGGVWVWRVQDGRGWGVCHEKDRERPRETLNRILEGGLREMVDFDVHGRFRPLKSSPGLVRGWFVLAESPQALGRVMEIFYPGGIADWWAWRRLRGEAVTPFRKLMGRQTGMYRITQKLSEEQAAWSVEGCCGGGRCVKQRRWSLDGVCEEGPEGVLSCLEPCAMLMEFARKCMRMEQGAAREVHLTLDDWLVLQEILRNALSEESAERGAEREADFGDLRNPRRIGFLLAKLEANLGGISSQGD